MYRFITIAAFASLVALSPQIARADAQPTDAIANAASTVSAPAAAAGTKIGAPTVTAMTVSRTGRVHVARIPGTFPVSSTQTSDEAIDEQLRLRVLSPALSGDGGG